MALRVDQEAAFLAPKNYGLNDDVTIMQPTLNATDDTTASRLLLTQLGFNTIPARTRYVLRYIIRLYIYLMLTALTTIKSVFVERQRNNRSPSFI